MPVVRSLTLILSVAVLAGCITPPPAATPPGDAEDAGSDMFVVADTRRDPPPASDVEPGSDVRSAPDALVDALVDAQGADVETSVDMTDADEPPPRSLVLIVGDQNALSADETSLISFFEGENYTVTPLSDNLAADAVAMAPDVVVMSRRASSGTVGAALRPLQSGLLHWEYAQQWADYTGMVSDPSDAAPTAQATGIGFYIDPDAPEDLRCGFQGNVPLYSSALEVTFAEPMSLGADAIRVGTLSMESARVTYYAYDRDATLADGTTAAGPRVYFGMGRDTWSELTDDGIELFRCALEWAASH